MLDYGTEVAKSALREVELALLDSKKYEKALVERMELLQRSIRSRVIFGQAELEMCGPGKTDGSPLVSFFHTVSC